MLAFACLVIGRICSTYPWAIRDLDNETRDGHGWDTSAVICLGQALVPCPPTGGVISSPGDLGSQQQDPKLAKALLADISSIVSFFSRGDQYPDSTSSLVPGQGTPGDPGSRQQDPRWTCLRYPPGELWRLSAPRGYLCLRFELSVSKPCSLCSFFIFQLASIISARGALAGPSRLTHENDGDLSDEFGC